MVLIQTVALGSAVAQERSDQVEYTDRTKAPKPARLTGTIKSEDPAQVVIVAGFNMKTVHIPSVDVTEVRYDKEPEEMSQARAAERGRRYEDAAAQYRAALKKAPASQRFLQAHLNFKLARLAALMAEGKPGAARQLAIEDLRNFRRDYPESRQTMECLELLGNLLIQEGQSAQEVIDALAGVKKKHGEFKELGARSDLLEARLLVEEARGLLRDQPDRAREKYALAQGKLQALLKAVDKSAELESKVALAECRAVQGDQAGALQDLNVILREAGDDRTRAAVYLGKGDCYRLQQQPREAMWEYRWVDVVYNQDREQQARALFHLQEVFDALKDVKRAQDCRERLVKDFADTRYARLVSAK
jgi:tetratricopeptide (TPR) repeat protein